MQAVILSFLFSRRIVTKCVTVNLPCSHRNFLTEQANLGEPPKPARAAEKLTYQGSNSWMMLSKRMTAKSLELNPASQARNRMVNDSRDCHPAGCDRPPDSPPPPPALLPLSATAVLLRPFPEYATPEFSEDLCFSETG